MRRTLEYHTTVETSPEELFAYHENPYTFFRMVTPYDEMKVLYRDNSLKEGSKTHLQVHLGPTKRDWVARHVEYDPPHGFTDLQEKGPFKSYIHHHIFAKKHNKTTLIDRIEYELPFGFWGWLFGSLYSKRKFRKLFKYRHKTVEEDFKHLNKHKDEKKFRILLSGSSGFVGSKMLEFLSIAGHDVHRLVRNEPKDDHEIFWDPLQAKLEDSQLEGFDFVVHLSGEGIDKKRWSKKQKKKIYDSRVISTQFLAGKLNNLKNPPKAFFIASGVNIYGDRPQENLTKDSEISKDGFLASVAKAWEDAASNFTKGRVIPMRFGAVIGYHGGVFKKLYKIFKSGFGATLGDGHQMMSWIALDDLVYKLYHMLYDEELSGPVNMISPNPISNKDFSKALAKALKRPLWFKIPKFLLVMGLGQLAKELLLSDTKVVLSEQEEKNYEYSYPTITDIFNHLLGR